MWRGRWRGMDVAYKKMFPDDMVRLGYSDKSYSNHTRRTSSSSTSSSSTQRVSGVSGHTQPDQTDQTELNQIALAMLENLEVGVMMRLRHPRIVAFLGAGEIIEPSGIAGIEEPRVGIFVMLEYAAGGDLTHRLKAAAVGSGGRVAESIALFSWLDRVQCALDIAEGMAFIHAEGFMHRDLKSLNVLCDRHGRCMIADLGK